LQSTGAQSDDRAVTNEEIIEKLKNEFPPPDYGVGDWDYGRQFSVVRIKDGRKVNGPFDHVRSAQNFDTHVKNFRDYFARP
jgi:hypothetical protein